MPKEGREGGSVGVRELSVWQGAEGVGRLQVMRCIIRGEGECS